jgi:two-component system response regulator
VSCVPGKPLVLLVEDNPDDTELALRAFRQCGVEVDLEVAGDGAAALARLEDLARAVPDLILLDIKLPLLGGLEVLRRLRALPRCMSCPVVVLTTSNEEHDIATAYRLGANSYLRKPVDYREFAQIVQALARYWLVLNTAP